MKDEKGADRALIFHFACIAYTMPVSGNQYKQALKKQGRHPAALNAAFQAPASKVAHFPTFSKPLISAPFSKASHIRPLFQ
ncbi:MAG: hypothetical protein ACE5ET_03925 [Gammaproteobacteria bacterium]